MYDRIKVIDEELSDPPHTVEGLEGYAGVKILARIHGTPLGWVSLPVINGQCTATMIRKNILEKHGHAILMQLMQNRLFEVPLDEYQGIEDLFNLIPGHSQFSCPPVTVVVCTRDRTDNLKQCLDSLLLSDYPNTDFLVVDNAPVNQDTARLVNESYPNVRYVCEDRPGLNWARNRAIREARGDIIAYTDDDVIVDKQWIRAIVDVFVKCPEVMAVTGLVVPFELETKAQNLFEHYGGFDRGFKRKWTQLVNDIGGKKIPFGTGQFGTGANMAYRRSFFDLIGFFDPALDVGTVTNGGGDLEMFFRVLKEGYVLVYEPRAMVRHRHRTDYESLKHQIRNNGIGFYSYLVRSAIAYPEIKISAARFGLWWFCWWSIRRLLLSLWYPMRLPRNLIWAELTGSIIGLRRYFKARRNAFNIALSFESEKQKTYSTTIDKKANSFKKSASQGTAVRSLNLSRPLLPIADVSEFNTVILYVLSDEKLYGCIAIKNNGHSIPVTLLAEVVVQHFGFKLIDHTHQMKTDVLWAKALSELYRRYMPDEKEEKNYLSNDISLSVVVATYDRPEDLRQCLQSLVNQKTDRKVEIIIVDNNPASGLTPPVVSEFPGVTLVSEKRKGLSYARNTGILKSVADIVVTTDDDVVAPPDWIEKLVTPFVQNDVMVVTGNVLPHELKNTAQHLFERYGGLGRGFNEMEVGAEWFESFKWDAVPTWRLGATANAAFRSTIFSHPEIGMFDIMLGAGTPTGCSEDTLLFYNVLKNGFIIKYEPSAYVWHKHRKDMASLRKQIYNYSKGHVAYHLLTFLRNMDLRAIFRIFYRLPSWHLQKLYRYIKFAIKRRPQPYPLQLILCEIKGHLAGPWSLWLSWRHFKRLGNGKSFINHVVPQKNPDPTFSICEKKKN